MMRYTEKLRKFRKNDQAISPVIGTILMVAATVIIAGAVYAAVNAYSGKAAKTGPDASFKAQAIDTDGNGLEDAIKITYLAGSSDADSVLTKVTNADSGDETYPTANLTSWDAGDYEIYKSLTDDTYFVTVLVGETTVLDQTLDVKE